MNTQKTSILDKVLGKINEIVKASADGDYIYRGETKDHGEVSSGLYREYREIEAEHFDIAVVQEDILREARKYTPHKMEHFELLATLQHHGDKTNLIDFTTDFHVALFFACDGKPGETGRVILLPKQSKDYTVKEAPRTIRRAETQKSIFVQAPKGVVNPDNVVSIPAELKSPLLDYLRRYHDISNKTIYNDLQGFIETRGLHRNTYTEFYKGVTCYERGVSAKTPAEKQKWYDTAITHYTEAVGLNPEFAQAYNYRGNAYAKKGDFNEAFEDFNKAIALNPELAEAYTNLGITYVEKFDFDAALRDFNKAIALNPELAKPYFYRGNVYSMEGNFDEAIEDYNQAIALKPEDAQAYNNRGVTYAKKGDLDEAIEDYNKAIALNPELAATYYNRSEIWLLQSDWQEAKEDLTTAKDMGVDIVYEFQNDHINVEDFEEKHGVNLPKDIAALLQGTESSGIKLARVVVREAVQEFTGGSTVRVFTPMDIIAVVLKNDSDFNVNTLRAKLAEGSIKNSANRYYTRIRSGKYRLYDPETDNVE